MCASIRTAGKEEETCLFSAKLVENKIVCSPFKMQIPRPHSRTIWLSRSGVGPRKPNVGLVVRIPSDSLGTTCAVGFVDSAEARVSFPAEVLVWVPVTGGAVLHGSKKGRIISRPSAWLAAFPFT